MANASLSAGESPQRTRQAWSVLFVSTLAFTVCFMVWMMFGVIGIPIKKMLNLSSTQFGLLTAMPVLTGSLVRVPLGIWTDKFGGRIVMTAADGTTVPAIWLMSYATEYWHFLTIGLFVGLAGGSFSVGTPYVARWFPKNRQGMAMGVYGAGNSGAAVNKFVAPVLCWWPLAGPWCRRCTPPSCWARWCCSGCSATATRPIWCPATSSSPTSSRRSRTPRCSSTASTTASCLVATWPCRCGWCSTTWANMAWTSVWPRCWRPASRCPAVCCAPLAACSVTSTAPTASPGG
jgi:nitrate/nitrite transporter NarK